MTDVVLNKKESIERCIRQIRLYYKMPSDKSFADDHFKQDAIAANLQRAAEQVIDIANHVIKKRKLGLPKESKESFEILAQAQVIPHELAGKMQGMIGFRNVLIHEYQRLDINILVDVIEHHLEDLIVFSNHVMTYLNSPSS
jgi:uncharacterized protein YutE (UPF0331/DUF86 family)